ncbi:structure-specific endonuclease subunit slx1 [Pseudozyma hubeiensis SY62]|uniref:Structure-specific endonuclease subunit slx1 n=1 Tax=Pseudozyma hubeiensis (strain SY62) TaxID=1305764 RepID=R9P4F8_PSEHS|nr:structure-specific endonuclease subunit slx1 [Pseudozyma hubeiensis SY62]GAC96308.1 structure-specific endonuclease subunit slx1 [Pseudozyma hubeiensis SY62]
MREKDQERQRETMSKRTRERPEIQVNTLDWRPVPALSRCDVMKKSMNQGEMGCESKGPSRRVRSKNGRGWARWGGMTEARDRKRDRDELSEPSCASSDSGGDSDQVALRNDRTTTTTKLNRYGVSVEQKKGEGKGRGKRKQVPENDTHLQLAFACKWQPEATKQQPSRLRQKSTAAKEARGAARRRNRRTCSSRRAASAVTRGAMQDRQPGRQEERRKKNQAEFLREV